MKKETYISRVIVLGQQGLDSAGPTESVKNPLPQDAKEFTHLHHFQLVEVSLEVLVALHFCYKELFREGQIQKVRQSLYLR